MVKMRVRSAERTAIAVSLVIGAALMAELGGCGVRSSSDCISSVVEKEDPAPALTIERGGLVYRGTSAPMWIQEENEAKVNPKPGECTYECVGGSSVAKVHAQGGGWPLQEINDAYVARRINDESKVQSYRIDNRAIRKCSGVRDKQSYEAGARGGLIRVDSLILIDGRYFRVGAHSELFEDQHEYVVDAGT